MTIRSAEARALLRAKSARAHSPACLRLRRVVAARPRVPDALGASFTTAACRILRPAGGRPLRCGRSERGAAEGVAILKDLVGVAQMLAIPTRRITGIEDPQTLAADAPPAFADGWNAKADVEGRLGGGRCRARRSRWRSIRNTPAAQDQLHVDVDCVRVDVDKALKDYAPALDDQWRAMTVPLNGRVYFARRLFSDNLFQSEPLSACWPTACRTRRRIWAR